MIYLRVTGSPGSWACHSIVLGEKFKVKNVDRIVVIQICSGRRVRVVIHADGQCIELIDHIVPVNVTGEQSNRGHGSVTCAYCDRSLSTQETTGCGTDAIGPNRSREAERPIGIRAPRGDQGIGPIVQTHRHRFAS